MSGSMATDRLVCHRTEDWVSIYMDTIYMYGPYARGSWEEEEEWGRGWERGRETERGGETNWEWLRFLKPQSPLLMKHFLQQGHSSQSFITCSSEEEMSNKNLWGPFSLETRQMHCPLSFDHLWPSHTQLLPDPSPSLPLSSKSDIFLNPSSPISTGGGGGDWWGGRR